MNRFGFFSASLRLCGFSHFDARFKSFRLPRRRDTLEPLARYVINAVDALLLPGEPGRLRARVQRAVPPLPGIGCSGARIAIEPERHAVTDAAGWIDVALEPDRYTLCADRAEPTTAVVARAPADRELFVTDIDSTLSDASSARALLAPNPRIKPMPGAVDVLRRLKNRFQIVYLTARNFAFTAKTKAWLALYGFPVAPLITRQVHFWEQPSGPYKHASMRALSERWSSIRFGVGDRSGELLAYA